MTVSANWVAGKVGYTVVQDDAGTLSELAMGEWRFPAEAVFVPRNAYTSRGYQEGVSGFKKVKFTIKGGYAKGQPRLILGVTYRFYLGIDTADVTEFYCDGHVSRMTPTSNAENAVDVEYECDSIGMFSIASDGSDATALGIAT